MFQKLQRLGCKNLNNLRVPKPRPSASLLQRQAVNARPQARGKMTHGGMGSFGGGGGGGGLRLLLRTRGAVSRALARAGLLWKGGDRLQRPTCRGGHTEARLPSREGPLLSGPVPGAAQQVWRGERPQVQVPRPGGLRLDRLSSVPRGAAGPWKGRRGERSEV